MTTNMTTNTSMLIRTAGVAVLLLAGALTPNAATAQAPRNLAEMRVAFAYHSADPAEAIYAHLQARARDACADHSSRSLRLQAFEAACARDLLDQAVAKINRADLAQLHGASPAPLTLAAR